MTRNFSEASRAGAGYVNEDGLRCLLSGGHMRVDVARLDLQGPAGGDAPADRWPATACPASRVDAHVELGGATEVTFRYAMVCSADGHLRRNMAGRTVQGALDGRTWFADRQDAIKGRCTGPCRQAVPRHSERPSRGISRTDLCGSAAEAPCAISQAIDQGNFAIALRWAGNYEHRSADLNRLAEAAYSLQDRAIQGCS